MKRRIFYYLEIALQLAAKKQDRRFLHAAVGIRSDGTLVQACNGPAKTPNRMGHAEYRLCRKLDYGAEVYVVRLSRETGQLVLSRPCNNCIKVLKSKKVKRVYYSIGPNEFGVMYL